jgi:hypothetical protein
MLLTRQVFLSLIFAINSSCQMHVLVHGAAVAVDTERDVNCIALKATVKTTLPSDVDLLALGSKVDLSISCSSSSTILHELVSSLFQLHSYNLSPYNIVSVWLVTNWIFWESLTVRFVQMV